MEQPVTKGRTPSRCREWERNRRNKFNEAITRLGDTMKEINRASSGDKETDNVQYPKVEIVEKAIVCLKNFLQETTKLILEPPKQIKQLARASDPRGHHKHYQKNGYHIKLSSKKLSQRAVEAEILSLQVKIESFSKQYKKDASTQVFVGINKKKSSGKYVKVLMLRKSKRKALNEKSILTPNATVSSSVKSDTASKCSKYATPKPLPTLLPKTTFVASNKNSSENTIVVLPATPYIFPQRPILLPTTPPTFVLLDSNIQTNKPTIPIVNRNNGDITKTTMVNILPISAYSRPLSVAKAKKNSAKSKNKTDAVKKTNKKSVKLTKENNEEAKKTNDQNINTNKETINACSTETVQTKLTIENTQNTQNSVIEINEKDQKTNPHISKENNITNSEINTETLVNKTQFNTIEDNAVTDKTTPITKETPKQPKSFLENKEDQQKHNNFSSEKALLDKENKLPNILDSNLCENVVDGGNARLELAEEFLAASPTAAFLMSFPLVSGNRADSPAEEQLNAPQDISKDTNHKRDETAPQTIAQTYYDKSNHAKTKLQDKIESTSRDTQNKPFSQKYVSSIPISKQTELKSSNTVVTALANENPFLSLPMPTLLPTPCSLNESTFGLDFDCNLSKSMPSQCAGYVSNSNIFYKSDPFSSVKSTIYSTSSISSGHEFNSFGLYPCAMEKYSSKSKSDYPNVEDNLMKIGSSRLTYDIDLGWSHKGFDFVNCTNASNTFNKDNMLTTSSYSSSYNPFNPEFHVPVVTNYSKKDSLSKPITSFPESMNKSGNSFSEAHTKSGNSFAEAHNKSGNSFAESHNKPSNSFAESMSKPRNSFGESTIKPRNSFSGSTIKPGNSFAESMSNQRNSFAESMSKSSNQVNQLTNKPKTTFVESMVTPGNTFSESTRKPITSFAESMSIPITSFTESISKSGNLFAESMNKPSNLFAEPMSRPANSFVETINKPSNSFAETMSKSANSYSETMNKPSNSFAGTMSRSDNSFVETINKPSNSFAETMSKSANSYSETMNKPSNSFPETMSRADNSFVETMNKPSNSFAETLSKPANSYAETMKKPSNSYAETMCTLYSQPASLWSEDVPFYTNSNVSKSLATNFLQHGQPNVKPNIPKQYEVKESLETCVENVNKTPSQAGVGQPTSDKYAKKSQSKMHINWMTSETRTVQNNYNPHLTEIKEISKPACSSMGQYSKKHEGNESNYFPISMQNFPTQPAQEELHNLQTWPSSRPAGTTEITIEPPPINLPTLVGDLALGPHDKKKTTDAMNRTTHPEIQNCSNFLSVTQLMNRSTDNLMPRYQAPIIESVKSISSKQNNSHTSIDNSRKKMARPDTQISQPCYGFSNSKAVNYDLMSQYPQTKAKINKSDKSAKSQKNSYSAESLIRGGTCTQKHQDNNSAKYNMMPTQKYNNFNPPQDTSVAQVSHFPAILDYSENNYTGQQYSGTTLYNSTSNTISNSFYSNFMPGSSNLMSANYTSAPFSGDFIDYNQTECNYTNHKYDELKMRSNPPIFQQDKLPTNFKTSKRETTKHKLDCKKDSSKKYQNKRAKVSSEIEEWSDGHLLWQNKTPTKRHPNVGVDEIPFPNYVGNQMTQYQPELFNGHLMGSNVQSVGSNVDRSIASFPATSRANFNLSSIFPEITMKVQ